MTFPLETVAGKTYQLKNITLMSVLEIAKLKDHYHEQKLTRILNAIIGIPEIVARLTAQERYAIFLRYLKLVEYNDLANGIVVDDYLAEDDPEFNHNRVFNLDQTVSVRHLKGVEAEALEIGCETTADWILGEFVMTIGCDELPAIDTNSPLNFTGNMIATRITEAQKLPTHRFNELYSEFLLLQSKLVHLVNFSFSKGIVLNKINGGTDDAPVRFRVDTAITGYAKDLLSTAIRENTSI